MENRLFRQESIDEVSSPEQMKDYPRVTTPHLWIALVAVVMLAGGFVVFLCSSGNEITSPVKVYVENIEESGENRILAEFTVSGEEQSKYSPGMQVRFAGVTGSIDYFVHVQEMSTAIVSVDNPQAQVADGEYDAVVVIDAASPIDDLLK